MPRRKVPRVLTSLPPKRLLQSAPHKTERLAELLREAAIDNQREQPHAFYSMRQVASHYQVPFAVVSRVYDRLEQEGLPTAVRGSKTILQGNHFNRHLGVRAFVGLPASLSAFVAIQAYRSFFIRIRRELRLRGFATAMAFFEKQEARTSSLSARLKAYEVDTVIWFQPPREARETLLRLGDLGIRIIGVAHEHVALIPCRYEVRRDLAVSSLLSTWRQQLAIDNVTAVRWPEHSAPSWKMDFIRRWRNPGSALPR